MQLTITPFDSGHSATVGGETWRRTFAGRPFLSRQRKHRQGLLLERTGILEILLRLAVVAGALQYTTRRATLRLGIIHIPLPRWLGPRVSAWERPMAEENRVHVSVEARLPWLGLLIAYDGAVAVIESPE
jgi:hypothetical protein